MTGTTSHPGHTSAQTIAVLTGASLMLTMSMGMCQSFGLLWLGVAPLVTGLVGQIFGLRYMATLVTGLAFFCHQTGSFVGAWGGGLIFDALGNYDLAWQIGVAIGVTAGIAQIFMDDKPTPRMTAAVPA